MSSVKETKQKWKELVAAKIEGSAHFYIELIQPAKHLKFYIGFPNDDGKEIHLML